MMTHNDHARCGMYVKTNYERVGWGSNRRALVVRASALLVALAFMLVLFLLIPSHKAQAEGNPDPGPVTFYAMFFNDLDGDGAKGAAETMAPGISMSFTYTNSAGVGTGFNAFSNADGYVIFEMVDCPCYWKMNAEGRRWSGDVVYGEGDTYVPVPVWNFIYRVWLSLIRN